jgi:hypothetical protein
VSFARWGHAAVASSSPSASCARTSQR